jgi:hypothetical protein
MAPDDDAPRQALRARRAHVVVAQRLEHPERVTRVT